MLNEGGVAGRRQLQGWFLEGDASQEDGCASSVMQDKEPLNSEPVNGYRLIISVST